jgi:hypothetical protein
MTIYQVVENSQALDSASDYDRGVFYYEGRDTRILKICSSLEIAERFLSTLGDNYLITIKQDNLYYDPDHPEYGPEEYPDVTMNRFTIEAIEIE